MASLLLRRERGFLQSLDLVAEAGGGFVVLAGDRLLEVGAELGELGLHLLRLGESTRRLAAVSRLAVDVLEQRRQLLAEDLVVVGATEPTGVAELDELDAALGTIDLREGGIVRLGDRLAGPRLAGRLRIAEVFL